MNEFRSSPCIELSHKHCACIEFVLSDRDRQGFHASQLLHYRLGTNEDEREGAPPQKLAIAFATADVTVIGWRLDRITSHLRDGDLLALRAVPTRYADLDPSTAHIARIIVEPIRKE